jgi:hypothetical protein
VFTPNTVLTLHIVIGRRIWQVHLGQLSECLEGHVCEGVSGIEGLLFGMHLPSLHALSVQNELADRVYALRNGSDSASIESGWAEVMIFLPIRAGFSVRSSHFRLRSLRKGSAAHRSGDGLRVTSDKSRRALAVQHSDCDDRTAGRRAMNLPPAVRPYRHNAGSEYGVKCKSNVQMARSASVLYHLEREEAQMSTCCLA